jgi:hypothetical protein
VVEFSVADVPGQPETLLIKEGVHNITFAWSTPATNGGAAISSYVIYRSEGGGAFRIIAIVPASVHALLDGGLTANVTYRYYVAAMNVMGTGISSNMAQATALPTPVSDGGHLTVAKNWADDYQGALVISGLMAVGMVCSVMFYYLYRRKSDRGITDWFKRRLR